MDGRPTWTDCDEAGDYVVPNVLSPRDLVFRPDNMDETVPHTQVYTNYLMSTLIFKLYIYIFISGRLIHNNSWRQIIYRDVFHQENIESL